MRDKRIEEQIDNLARVIDREVSAATVEAGLMLPSENVPWEQMTPAAQAVLKLAAVNIYERLVPGLDGFIEVRA